MKFNRIEILENSKQIVANSDGDELREIKFMVDATIARGSYLFGFATPKQLRYAKKLTGIHGDIKTNAFALIDLMIEICKEYKL